MSTAPIGEINLEKEPKRMGRTKAIRVRNAASESFIAAGANFHVKRHPISEGKMTWVTVESSAIGATSVEKTPSPLPPYMATAAEAKGFGLLIFLLVPLAISQARLTESSRSSINTSGDSETDVQAALHVHANSLRTVGRQNPSSVPFSHSMRNTSSLIPESMIGFSIEIANARIMLSEDGSKERAGSVVRKSFLQLLATLRRRRSRNQTTAIFPNSHHYVEPDVLLRLGGNSADQTCAERHSKTHIQSEKERWGKWEEDKTDKNGRDGIGYNFNGSSICRTNLTDADYLLWRAFASLALERHNLSIGFILGTNLAIRDPEVAKDEVQRAVELGLFRDGILLGVEIGNEVDSYIVTHPHSQMSFYPGYTKEFERYLERLDEIPGFPDGKVIQGAVFASPYRLDYSAMLPLYGKKYNSRLRSISMHNYPTTTCKFWRKNTPTVSMEDLLRRRSSRGQSLLYKPFVHLAMKQGLTFVLGEANSASCGGQHNVSDTLGAALWSLDYSAEMSKIGVRGINFHGGPTGSYAPVTCCSLDGAAEAQPLFYGMWMFSELVMGSTYWLETDTSPKDLDSDMQYAFHAVVAHSQSHRVDNAFSTSSSKNSDSEVRVLIINKGFPANAAANLNTSIAVSTDVFYNTVEEQQAGGSFSSLTEPKFEACYVALKSNNPQPSVYDRFGLQYGGQTMDSSISGAPSGTYTCEKIRTNVRGTTYKTMVVETQVQIETASAAIVYVRASTS
eukprot:jgi/Bigna1/80999/fgenesh1_pg.76_\